MTRPEPEAGWREAARLSEQEVLQQFAQVQNLPDRKASAERLGSWTVDLGTDGPGLLERTETVVACACGATPDRACLACGRRACGACQPQGGAPCRKCQGPVWGDEEQRTPGGRNPQMKGY